MHHCDWDFCDFLLSYDKQSQNMKKHDVQFFVLFQTLSDFHPNLDILSKKRKSLLKGVYFVILYILKN